MKRLISLILFLTMVALIGCATAGGAGRGASGNLTDEVGNAQFVGATSIGVPWQQDVTMSIAP